MIRNLCLDSANEKVLHRGHLAWEGSLQISWSVVPFFFFFFLQKRAEEESSLDPLAADAYLTNSISWTMLAALWTCQSGGGGQRGLKEYFSLLPQLEYVHFFCAHVRDSSADTTVHAEEFFAASSPSITLTILATRED